jgi:hypothetical protein
MGISVDQWVFPVSLSRAITEEFVVTKTMPSNAVMKLWIPGIFAFQRMVEVEGAGPDEKREKAESPVSCGHSN